MDDYMFRHYVGECRVVEETTSYLELLSYSDPLYNSSEEHLLTSDEFENFLRRRGAFEPVRLRDGVKLLSGIRLKNAKDKDTFAPRVISLPKESYEMMVRLLRLPFRGIETSAVVGPFFWSSFDRDEEDGRLQIIHRKSDVRKKGKTRGWEIMLSHSFATGLTTGYVKGTSSSDVTSALQHVRSCCGQNAAATGHALLLPTIMLSLDLSPANDQKQREARDWLRHLENAVSLRDEVEPHERYAPDGLLEIDGLSRDLVECHGHVMWKRPQAYRALVGEMEVAMGRFREGLLLQSSSSSAVADDDDDDVVVVEQQQRTKKDLLRMHASIMARLEFYRVKLTGLENYVHITLARLKVQREALYNIMSQREARLNLEIAGEQRRIAHASKRDSTAMKTISLMGALFLPGTYLASVFSTSFFDFKPTSSRVASDLWIYFIVTIPLTAAIVGSWWWWDRRREAQFARDDEDLEKNIDKMERDIMFHLRKRTMSKAHTWNSVSAPPRP
ncbi:hypothetical protein CP532_4401 [Ophiocordyceps camponoti-leonardi (nom. inval.)]|nr:hypothetical protein CP532_4401 [Ophiocordyceps camponoti-leonardi (nom. inval.)]